jgi:hypothetical protein
MVAAISGIIGAKVFHNLENLGEFEKHPLEALVSFSGLTMYGGLIFGCIAVMWYGNKYGIKPLILADSTAPGLMLAYGTGRLGCQIAGDGDWGIVNLNPKPSWLNWLPDWAWSYNYPNNVINEGIPIPGCIGKHCMMLPDAVYPTPQEATDAVDGTAAFGFQMPSDDHVNNIEKVTESLFGDGKETPLVNETSFDANIPAQDDILDKDGRQDISADLQRNTNADTPLFVLDDTTHDSATRVTDAPDAVLDSSSPARAQAVDDLNGEQRDILHSDINVFEDKEMKPADESFVRQENTR